MPKYFDRKRMYSKAVSRRRIRTAAALYIREYYVSWLGRICSSQWQVLLNSTDYPSASKFQVRSRPNRLKPIDLSMLRLNGTPRRTLDLPFPGRPTFRRRLGTTVAQFAFLG